MPSKRGEARGRNWKKIVLLTLLCLVAGSTAMVLGVYSYRSGKSPVRAIREVFEPPFGGKQRINILALGVDNSDPKQGLSDTMILLSADLAAQRLYGVSIPRDTRVEDERVGYTHKVNEAFRRGGHELAIPIVEGLLGITIDYYVKVNLEGFEKCVNILGGVDIDVEKNMRYRDRAQNLNINLKKGMQHLDGNKAMQYVRFRRDAMGDITRTQRQQKFLRALVDKVLTPANIPQLPRLMAEVLRHLETNLSPKDAIYLANFASHVSGDRLVMQTLPGTPSPVRGISYWMLDEEKVAQIMDQYFRPAPYPEQAPTVMVLNGNGMEGSAARFAESLSMYGFRIQSCGNAERHDYDNSRIIARNGSIEKAREIVSLLPGATLTEEYRQDAMTDITVILGKDYHQVQ